MVMMLFVIIGFFVFVFEVLSIVGFLIATFIELLSLINMIGWVSIAIIALGFYLREYGKRNLQESITVEEIKG